VGGGENQKEVHMAPLHGGMAIGKKKKIKWDFGERAERLEGQAYGGDSSFKKRCGRPKFNKCTWAPELSAETLKGKEGQYNVGLQ